LYKDDFCNYFTTFERYSDSIMKNKNNIFFVVCFWLEVYNLNGIAYGSLFEVEDKQQLVRCNCGVLGGKNDYKRTYRRIFC